MEKIKNTVRPSSTSVETKDVYQMITDRFIAGLEKGKLPWQKPWSCRTELMPQNYATKHQYSNLNLLILAMNDYEHPYYMTFNQLKEQGGSIRKGATATPITYWNFVPYMLEGSDWKKVPKESVEVLRKAGKVIDERPFLKYYNVFNIADIEGIEFYLPEHKEIPAMERIENCEAIIAGFQNRPTIVHGKTEAYYNVGQDSIFLPTEENFVSNEHYYQTLFHEMIHATGHKKRLNREELATPTKFGTKQYSKEELTAEIGACFLSGKAGLSDLMYDNSQAYINGWISKLENDKMFIFSAASKAKSAVAHILGE